MEHISAQHNKGCNDKPVDHIINGVNWKWDALLFCLKSGIEAREPLLLFLFSIVSNS